MNSRPSKAVKIALVRLFDSPYMRQRDFWTSLAVEYLWQEMISDVVVAVQHMVQSVASVNVIPVADIVMMMTFNQPMLDVIESSF